jgi:hypothetical protein
MINMDTYKAPDIWNATMDILRVPEDCPKCPYDKMCPDKPVLSEEKMTK